MEDTYEAYIFCNNCYKHDKIKINKGSPINQVSCPNCGNLSIEIDPNGESFDKAKKRGLTSYR